MVDRMGGEGVVIDIRGGGGSGRYNTLGKTSKKILGNFRIFEELHTSATLESLPINSCTWNLCCTEQSFTNV